MVIRDEVRPTQEKRGEGQKKQGERLMLPSLFFLLSILYQELFLKLYCFRTLTPRGVVFTLLFTLPIALLLGLWCASVSARTGRLVLVGSAVVVAAWIASQTVYYHLFQTFMSLFSLTQMGMVAAQFGGMAVQETVENWLPILAVLLPVAAAVLLRKRLVPDGRAPGRLRLAWAGAAAVLQLLVTLLVLASDSSTLSLRHIYTQSDSPELIVTNFGMLTHTRLELKRELFGAAPADDGDLSGGLLDALQEEEEPLPDYDWGENAQTMDIDFEALVRSEMDEELLAMHRYFAGVEPTFKNEWTGYFQGKNLIWIVAESFSSLAVDPELTPTLYRLSQEGFVFENFYTPLWGVSTSDGEYVTTTGLIPKAGAWSYLQSAENYMPFGFGNLFSQLGYRTLAYHNNTYTYYGRDLSYPNMGYEYYGLGNGLEVERTWPESDVEMMELSVPQYIQEDHFMVYYLTVSGHLNYNIDQNDMARKHWDAVKDLPYGEGPRAYLACQMELDQALASLISQLEAAGKLDDTVIVLSGDHYPYGLQEEEISQLLGHPVEPDFEKYKSNLILWNSAMEEPVRVDKFCSSLDIMPTLANLFGLEYDSRLLAGRDILSDAPGLVMFFNYNFLSEEGAYLSSEDTFTTWDGSEPDLDYVGAVLEEMRNRSSYSAMILDKDYYRVVFQSQDGP